MGLRWVSKSRSKKGKFMKGVIVSMLLFLFIFTLFILWLFYKTSSEPSTLITCVFAFCSAEGGFLTIIKKTKGGTKNE